MSLGIVLDCPEILGGIAALSGRILPEYLIKSHSSKLDKFPILLSHGLHDEVLSIDYARSAHRILSELPVNLSYAEFPMGHDVTEINFTDVKNWLKERLDIPHKR